RCAPQYHPARPIVYDPIRLSAPPAIPRDAFLPPSTADSPPTTPHVPFPRYVPEQPPHVPHVQYPAAFPAHRVLTLRCTHQTDAHRPSSVTFRSSHDQTPYKAHHAEQSPLPSSDGRQ